MATTTLHPMDKPVEHAVVLGSSTEALAGAGAVVLAILGLAGIAPAYMVAIAAIALGAALIFNGGAIAMEYSRIMAASGNGTLQTVELGGGLSSQIGAGVAAVVLGVLALLGIKPEILISISAIVLGVSMVFSSGLVSRLNTLKIETSGEQDVAKRVAHEAVSAATGTDVLVGLAAAVLGVLSLVGFAPMTLNLVAMLALGAAVLLTGSALVGKMMSMFTA